MTPEQFKARFGFESTNDDIDRVLCFNAGEIGHESCGLCPCGKMPRFTCSGWGMQCVGLGYVKEEDRS